MANFVQIFVEGDADVKFLSDYIVHILSNTAVEMRKEKVADISIDGAHKIKIQGLNGWTDVHNVHNQFIENTDNDGVNLIVFDADFIETAGGFDKRKREIEDKIKGLSYEIFLFPNNRDDGALEDLLENIINEINKPIFDCWSKFEHCLREYASREIKKELITPAKKSKIHVYLETLSEKSSRKKKKIREPYRNYRNAAHWNLDADYLNPLKDFLLQHLQISNPTP
jgi:hypothetical protein